MSRSLKESVRAACALLIFCVVTQASTITVNFNGIVTSLPDPTGVFAGAAIGDLFSGLLVYDDAAQPVTIGSNPAQYLYTGATTPAFATPLGISVTLHGITITPRYPGAMVITVQNDLASNPTFPDVFIAQSTATSPGAGVDNPQIDFAVADRTGTALGSTALPASLNLSGFTDSSFRLFNNTSGSTFDIFIGTINTTGVPEPASTTLITAGVLALLVSRRKIPPA
jgi:hypothetical protein